MTAQYHDALDRREAKERAEQAEREQAMRDYDESRRHFTIDDYEARPQQFIEKLARDAEAGLEEFAPLIIEDPEIDDLAAQYEARAAQEMSESISSSDPERVDVDYPERDTWTCDLCGGQFHSEGLLSQHTDEVHGLASQECTCGPDPDARACPSCRARAQSAEIPF